MKEKNLNIEVLRGILMIWIVLFHYTTRFKELFGYNPFSYEFEWGGEIGVAFFFVISGFLYYSSLLRMDKLSLIDVGKFCFNKYWRLYPAYLVSIIFIYSFYQFVDLPTRECSLKDFLVNIIFIFHPGFQYVDSAHWFIAVLIKIQVLSALFLLFTSSKRGKLILTFEFFIISIVVLFPYFTMPFKAIYELLLSPDCFLKFLLGYNFYMIISSKGNIKYLHAVLAIVIIGYYCYTINALLIIVFSLLTFVVLQNKKIPTLHIFKPLAYIGSHSFMWYLIHQNIGFAILYKLNDIGLSREIAVLIPMLITFFLSLIIKRIIDGLPRKLVDL